MQKAIHEIKTIEEWEQITKSGMVHKDKEAHIYISGHIIDISQSLFHRIVIRGCSRAVINLPADSNMQIDFKDNATGILQRGTATAKGESKVIALGRSTLTLTHRATGFCFDEAEVILQQESVAYLFDESSATAKDKSVVYSGDYSTASVEGEAIIRDAGTTGLLSSLANEKNEGAIKKRSWRTKRKYMKHRNFAEHTVNDVKG